MFDDNQTNTGGGVGQPPVNLPTGEVDDMFAVTDGEAPAEPQPPAPELEIASRTEQPTPPSAVSAGVLKPRIVQPTASASVPEEPLPGVPTYGSGTVKEPVLAKRLLIGAVVIVIFGGLGFGGWYLYSYLTRARNAEPAEPLPTPSGIEIAPTEPETSASAVDQSLLFGEPIDTDADNLDDIREQSIGTDPRNWDSDGDELSDGDEVIIWKTQPLNPDTDGDTFLDGQEVKNGYSPSGAGKIFQPPTESP